MNLTGFESAFRHKQQGSVRPGTSWGAPRCIPALGFDDHQGMRHAGEPVLIETFVPEAPIE